MLLLLIPIALIPISMHTRNTSCAQFTSRSRGLYRFFIGCAALRCGTVRRCTVLHIAPRTTARNAYGNTSFVNAWHHCIRCE